MLNKILENSRKLLSFFERQSRIRKLLLTCAFAGGLISAVVITIFFLTWSGLLGSIPDREELSLVENPVSSEVYSADSVLLGRYFIQERSDIRFDQIPSHVVNALLATEDVRFYDHRGIDYRSLGRVFVKSILLQRDVSGGGSTLTQQLAKNLYPRKHYWFFSTLINKIREIIIASRLEQVYDKNTLLTLYFNTVPFGDNTYGIESAAQRFFSKATKEISIDEGAILIGMLKATHSYNPRIFPERSKERRNVVLLQMEKYKKLPSEKLDSLRDLPLKIKYNKITHHAGLAPYFREYIRKELVEWCSNHTNEKGEPFNLYTDGLKIYTTIDSRLQNYAEVATTKEMTLLQNSFLKHWGRTDPWHNQVAVLDEAIKKSDRYKSLKQSGKSHEEIIQEMKKPSMMNVFTWQGEKEVKMSSIDSIKHYLKFLNAGLLAMDPQQGAIRVWVGGINHNYFQFDHVRESTKRQVGSTFKPIVYAAALEEGEKPCNYISAEKTTYESEEDWTPLNTEENYDLKYSMEGALAYSVNTVAVHTLENAGIDQTISLAEKMGITSKLPPVPSLALGTPNISVMEMVTAYSCIANNGRAVKPWYLTSICAHNNIVLESFHPEIGEQVLSEDNAKMLVQMLKRVVNEGTGSSMRRKYGIENDIAGKTGTTQSNADGWFMAMTPKLVIGAWVGADDQRIRFRTTALGQGASTALPIVANFFQQINSDRELTNISNTGFPELPSNLQRKLSCDFYKSDKTVLEKIFGKKNKESSRAFGEKKQTKGFFKRLFGL
ncbi:MAG TPA: transglycosylase domain-containing protein [Cyclobacteriaceae bacterium]